MILGNLGFLGVITTAALIDSINPCAFSILFLTVAFLFSLGKQRREVLFIGGLYILGIFIVYTLIGLGILRALDVFGFPHFAASIGATIIIIAGLIQIANVIWKDFPIRLKIPQFAHGNIAKFVHKASMPSAFILGLFVGLMEFPCTGGPYLYVLSLLHDASSTIAFFKASIYLIWYNFVFVLPLIIILILASTQKSAEVIDRVRKSENKRTKIITALIMILLGAIMFAV